MVREHGMFSLFLNCSRNVLVGFFFLISFLAIGSFCGWSFETAILQYGKEVYCRCYCCCSWILCSWYCFTVSCRKERNRDRDRYPYTHICIVHVGRCTRAQFFFVRPLMFSGNILHSKTCTEQIRKKSQACWWVLFVVDFLIRILLFPESWRARDSTASSYKSSVRLHSGICHIQDSQIGNSVSTRS